MRKVSGDSIIGTCLLRFEISITTRVPQLLHILACLLTIVFHAFYDHPSLPTQESSFGGISLKAWLAASVHPVFLHGPKCSKGPVR
jgi:hypothetical protein